jgi:hypothetical protein
MSPNAHYEEGLCYTLSLLEVQQILTSLSRLCRYFRDADASDISYTRHF